MWITATATQSLEQETVFVICVHTADTPRKCLLVSPPWPVHCESPTGNLRVGEVVPMLPCWSTCSTNSGVDVAAAVIGRDKISSTFITDSLCSIYSASLPFYQLQAHPRWPPLQPKQNFPRETLCDGEKNTDKEQSYVSSQTATSLRNKSGMSCVIIFVISAATQLNCLPALCPEVLSLIKSSLSLKDSNLQ